MSVFSNVITPQGLEPLQFPTKFRSHSSGGRRSAVLAPFAVDQAAVRWPCRHESPGNSAVPVTVDIQRRRNRQAERHETVRKVESIGAETKVEAEHELDIPGDLKTELRRLLTEALVNDYLTENMGINSEDGDSAQGDAIPRGKTKRTDDR